MQKISLDEFLRLRKLVLRNARPLDYTKWKFLFENGSPSWLPLPVYFVDSPESSFYPECKRTVNMNLDTIIDSLLNTHEIQLPSAEELDAYEQNTPHPDGKRWCVAEQTIGNYYWGSNFIIRDLDILRKFGRLEFDLPVLIQ